MADLLDRQAALKKLLGEAVAKYPCSFIMGLAAAADELKKLPAIDAVEVVRCKDCKHGVWDADEELWKCVVSADWNEEVGDYIGFLEYHEADDFCGYGERREENG